MNELTKTQLKRIEQLKIEIRERETEIEMLMPEVVPEIPEDAEIATERGTFTLGSRSKWEYSTLLTNLEKDVKARQKDEQQRGIAKETKGKPYLIYRSNE